MVNIDKCIFCGADKVIKHFGLLETLEGKRLGTTYYCSSCLRTLEYIITNPMEEE